MSRIILKAPEGYYYTDGTNYAKISYLAEGMSKDGYYLITDAEYNRILEEQEKNIEQ